MRTGKTRNDPVRRERSWGGGMTTVFRCQYPRTTWEV